MFWNLVFRLLPNQGKDFKSLLLSSLSMKDYVRDRIRIRSNLLESILIATKPSEAASVTFSSSHLAAISVDCSSSPARYSTHVNLSPPQITVCGLSLALLQLLAITTERHASKYFNLWKAGLSLLSSNYDFYSLNNVKIADSSWCPLLTCQKPNIPKFLRSQWAHHFHNHSTIWSAGPRE